MSDLLYNANRSQLPSMSWAIVNFAHTTYRLHSHLGMSRSQSCFRARLDGVTRVRTKTRHRGHNCSRWSQTMVMWLSMWEVGAHIERSRQARRSRWMRGRSAFSLSPPNHIYRPRLSLRQVARLSWLKCAVSDANFESGRALSSIGGTVQGLLLRCRQDHLCTIHAVELVRVATRLVILFIKSRSRSI